MRKIEKRGKRKGKAIYFLKLLFSLFSLTSFLSLSACGFHPVYGSYSVSQSTSDQLNQVAIDNIPDRKGQILRNDLIDRMYGKGRPHEALYHLNVKINGGLQDLGIQANATSTRSLLDLTASYNLVDANGKSLLSGSAHSITSFNKLSDQYASEISTEEAYERTLKEVSEQIVNRLSVYFAEPQNSSPDVIARPPSLPSLDSKGMPTTSSSQHVD